MKSTLFREWLSHLPQLTRKQRLQLRDQITAVIVHDEVVALLESGTTPRCTACGSLHHHRWGRQAGLQRYRCCDCQRTFTVLSGTPLAHLRHKAVWLKFSQALNLGLTVRAAAQLCQVNKNTTFRWRHRFLQIPAQLKAAQLQGIVEADETYFPLSFKGDRHLSRPAHRRGHATHQPGTGSDQVPVLVLRDRQGTTTDFKLSVANTVTIEPLLARVLPRDVVLCSDGAAVYRLAAAHLGFSHRAVNLSRGQRIRGAYHVQNVNAYDSRLKTWMMRFHGVATKYLENYLGWRRWLDREGKSLTERTGLEQALGRNNPYQLLT